MQLCRAIPLFLWCLLIFWLSSRHDIVVPYAFSQEDKLFHAAAYAAMAALFWFWMRGLPVFPTGRMALAGLLFCSLYGVSDEWHQSFVSGRDASVYDWLADTLGAALMLAVLVRRGIAGAGMRG